MPFNQLRQLITPNQQAEPLDTNIPFAPVEQSLESPNILQPPPVLEPDIPITSDIPNGELTDKAQRIKELFQKLKNPSIDDENQYDGTDEARKYYQPKPAAVTGVRG